MFDLHTISFCTNLKYTVYTQHVFAFATCTEASFTVVSRARRSLWAEERVGTLHTSCQMTTSVTVTRFCETLEFNLRDVTDFAHILSHEN